MECTIATLIACFSWSNLYLDGGMSYLDVGETVIEKRWVENYVYVADHEPTHSTRFSEVEARSPHNPYGRLSLGYQVELPSVTLSLELSHLSSIATNQDRGVNSISFKARWFPFR